MKTNPKKVIFTNSLQDCHENCDKFYISACKNFHCTLAKELSHLETFTHALAPYFLASPLHIPLGCYNAFASCFPKFEQIVPQLPTKTIPPHLQGSLQVEWIVVVSKA